MAVLMLFKELYPCGSSSALDQQLLKNWMKLSIKKIVKHHHLWFPIDEKSHFHPPPQERRLPPVATKFITFTKSIVFFVPQTAAGLACFPFAVTSSRLISASRTNQLLNLRFKINRCLGLLLVVL